jgi:hypothetical protein
MKGVRIEKMKELSYKAKELATKLEPVGFQI